jgi:alpha-glucosidase
MERIVRYYGGGAGAHLPFNFQLIELPWDARGIARAVAAYEAALPPGAWPNWVLGNHDRSRVASRVGDAQARVAAMLLLTLRGTPTLYQGDEIGLRDVPIPPELVQDPWERNIPGLGYGRDPERTPMQWDASPNAGFTTGTPWLPVADDYACVNVDAQRDDPTSMLTLHRRLIALRRAEPALAVGSWTSVEAEGDLLAYLREHGDFSLSLEQAQRRKHDYVAEQIGIGPGRRVLDLGCGWGPLLAYIRERGGRRFLVLLNLGHRPCAFTVEGLSAGVRVVLSTHLDREEAAPRDAAAAVALRADEGVVVELS